MLERIDRNVCPAVDAMVVVHCAFRWQAELVVQRVSGGEVLRVWEQIAHRVDLGGAA